MFNLAIAPDTQQNILYAAYFIFLHNFQAILYASGIIIITLWAFYKPTRGKLIIMWGFIILLFAFEYNKHIVESLRQQTLQSLITERPSWRIERIINFLLLRAFPKGLPLLGWLMVLLGSIVEFFNISFNKKLK